MKKEMVIYSEPSLQEAKKRQKREPIIYRDQIFSSDRLKLFATRKHYFIRTYGCQANEVDSQNIAGILEDIGFLSVEDPLKADFIILNTCAIRENAEDKVFGEVGALKRVKMDNPNAIIAVCGCMVQQPHVVERVKKTYRQVDLLFGTHNLHRLPILLDEVIFQSKRVIEVFSKEGEVIEHLPIVRDDKIKASVNIMYGCDKFCTYCIVPYTRGKQRSRLQEDILQECQHLIDQGYQEITLLGQNVNAYGKDLTSSLSFAVLLENVAKLGVPRLRFMTSHPWDFTEAMFQVIAKYPNIMPYIHLPLQSGSDRILKKMGRRYTKESYLALVDRLKEIIPNVAISTDIIVGFPEETEADFLETLAVVESCQYDAAFTFIYSPRIGTPAASIVDGVSNEVKHHRFQRLIDTLTPIVEKKAEMYVGQVVQVLVEGTSKKEETILTGYTDTMKLVNFKGDLSCIGTIVSVKILSSHTFSLMGEQVK